MQGKFFVSGNIHKVEVIYLFDQQPYRFIYMLFNDVVSSLVYVASNNKKN